MKRKFTWKKGWGRKKERKKQTGCSCIIFFIVCLLPLFDQSFNPTVLSVDIQKYDFWLVMHRKYSINVLSICFFFRFIQIRYITLQVKVPWSRYLHWAMHGKNPVENSLKMKFYLRQTGIFTPAVNISCIVTSLQTKYCREEIIRGFQLSSH